MLTQKTILIVEDDIGIRNAVYIALESWGYNPKTADNGLEALELIRKSSLPDLILLDMRMPVMDGWAFAQEFRKEFGLQTPIVVMTAAGDATERARSIGADDCLGKPFKLRDLKGSIEKKLGRTAETKAA